MKCSKGRRSGVEKRVKVLGHEFVCVRVRVRRRGAVAAAVVCATHVRPKGTPPIKTWGGARDKGGREGRKEAEPVQPRRKTKERAQRRWGFACLLLLRGLRWWCCVRYGRRVRPRFFVWGVSCCAADRGQKRAVVCVHSKSACCLRRCCFGGVGGQKGGFQACVRPKKPRPSHQLVVAAVIIGREREAK